MIRLTFAAFILLVSVVLQAEETEREHQIELMPHVVIKTNLGDIYVQLNEEDAPATVSNFLDYVDRDGFDNTIFHRVIPDFMIQGGGYYQGLAEAREYDPVINEATNGLKNVRGTIAMARQNEIDSARRNFFINVASNRSLNHHSKKSCTREDEAAVAKAKARGVRKPMKCKSFGYAVFGKVVSGMDVVDLIEVAETQSIASFDDVPVDPIVIMSIDRVLLAEVPLPN